MKFIIVAYYGEGDAQMAWAGKRWVDDVSNAETYTTERRALRAFRAVAALVVLVPRASDRVVIVEDYGLVTERVAYHLNADGVVAAGPSLTHAHDDDAPLFSRAGDELAACEVRLLELEIRLRAVPTARHYADRIAEVCAKLKEIAGELADADHMGEG